jgi:hypothetical protein
MTFTTMQYQKYCDNEKDLKYYIDSHHRYDTLWKSDSFNELETSSRLQTGGLIPFNVTLI